MNYGMIISYMVIPYYGIHKDKENQQVFIFKKKIYLVTL